MKKARITGIIGLAVLLGAGFTNATYAHASASKYAAAIKSKALPLSALRKMTPRTGHSSEAFTRVGLAKKSTGLSTFSTSGTPGVDSLTNWSDQFTAPGFDGNGNPQSVWPYTMVGNPPESGRSSRIGAPIVPVILDLLAPDGTIAIYNGAPLTFAPGPDVIQAALGSPIFQPFIYTSGIGQFNDQMMRAEFWNRIQKSGDGEGEDGGWHTNLVPKLRTARHMEVPFGSWSFFIDANGNPVLAAVEANAFSNLFFPPTYPVDNSTVIGAAELAGDVTTRDMSTFLYNNTVLYVGNTANCCIIGFHTYDFEPGTAQNGNRERRYVLNYSSWLSPGLFAFGFEDITPWSHELNETYNDPFVNNATPWWLSVDPVLGGGNCQNNLETGDVVEVLASSVPTYSIAMNGRTYHPQNVAMFNWFAFQSPSQGHLGAYSFPDEDTLPALSPGNLQVGCVPAP